MGFKPRIRAISVAGLVFFAFLGQALAEKIDIVGFGDSLMAGYQLEPGQSFPEKLEAALEAKGHDVSIANAGVSGDTTSGGLGRLDWSVPDGTDLVILELGANDMLRGVSPSITESNLDAMLARLKERGIDVVLAGMLAAPNLGADYAEAFNGLYPRLAGKYDVTFFPFFMEGVATNGQLLLDDGLHPNAEGVDRMVAEALPYVEEAISQLD
ncbi:arylesterase [Aquibium oceanicum]|uniref:Arylesterase n=1 Tax=Aquibium oceanicum TaxID=1670800 RepID=A0A1L3SZU2_9HYPH|nr:arylesterase [Aquibium oceanicum]APH74832.1 arylesterase [Aquibium oceanicum]